MHLSWRRTAAHVAVAAALLVSPGGVDAQAPAPTPEPGQPTPDASAQARELFLRGQSAYSQGDYDTAIESWRAAFELDARPLILYNLSQAYERAGLVAEATQTLERYLELTPGTDPNIATARNRLASLRERLARTGILVQDAPTGAEIFVDDVSWGLAPRPDPIQLEPGSHRVRLTLEGYSDFELAISVPAGQTITVTAEMQEAGGGGGSRVPSIVMMGAGGGLVVTAAILGGLALGTAKDSEFSTGSDADRAQTLALTSDILGAVGLAAAAGGLVWFLVAGGDDDGSESADLRRFRAVPVVGRDLVGLDATVQF